MKGNYSNGGECSNVGWGGEDYCMLAAMARSLAVEADWVVAKVKVAEVLVAGRSLRGMEVEDRDVAGFVGVVGNSGYPQSILVLPS